MSPQGLFSFATFEHYGKRSESDVENNDFLIFILLILLKIKT